MNRDMQALMRQAVARGCTVTTTGGKHLKVVLPDGTAVFAPRTPSDHRSVRNVRAKLRRAGLDI